MENDIDKEVRTALHVELVMQAFCGRDRTVLSGDLK